MFTSRLAVLGAGLMGVGIACHFARHGHAVRLYDTDPQRLAEVPAVASAILRELEASGHRRNLGETLRVGVIQADDVTVTGEMAGNADAHQSRAEYRQTWCKHSGSC